MQHTDHPGTQGLHSSWPAVMKRVTLERSDLKSGNRRLPVELRMLSRINKHGSILQRRGHKICVKSDCKGGYYVLNERKDIMAVLPTGYGRSLIYQIMAPFAEFMCCHAEPTAHCQKIVLVISPLNALIRNQVTKLRASGLKSCMLKADRGC